MLELYMHPLASYCWKVLLALYETEIPFTPRVIDLADTAQRAELASVWPFARFPVLRDHARGETIPESSIIVEYLARQYPEAAYLVPASDLDVRARDRFFDLNVMEPMGRIVRAVLQSRAPEIVTTEMETLLTAYDVVETFPERSDFTLADCAAGPALFYADQLVPIPTARPRTRAYVERLLARPAMQRVRREAEPYWSNFDGVRRAFRSSYG